ncbi:outer membrane beta-barrel protein [Flagellimonas sp. CMM7]|uniref:outer membrane beta-barrel protein n=1 Tax=Flagellimonas sp. CMM7 TaxID=2654676 RepID=UPI0013D28938|nr:outer membrane beta-barrel protein [Flagellimonas sp. CMM7]UII81111.1 porin family protein [Flagellimonas sp. CMM7]
MTSKLKLLTTLMILFSIADTYCQNFEFGVSGGLLNGSSRVMENNASASYSDTGFYLGLYSKIQLNKKIMIIPEIDYGNLNDSSFGFLSARVGYYLNHSFYLQGGGQMTYLFDVLNDEISKTGLDLSLGIGYDITNKFNIQARYALELTNRIKEPTTDVKGKFNWLHIGLGYTF